MADRNTLAVRSNVASVLAAWLTAPGEMNATRREYAELLDNGNAVAIAAGPDESAALTIHRIERHKAPTVILATIIDGDPVVGALHVTDDLPEGRTCFDVPGGFTVRDWVLRMQEHPNKESFTAEGREFAAVIGSLSPVVAA